MLSVLLRPKALDRVGQGGFDRLETHRYCISKDLFFDYKRFSEPYQWGDPDLLLDIIAISEQSLVREIDITKIKKLTTELDAIIPDTGDFGEFLGSYTP